MTILFVILGGAAGGVLGWLFDRATNRRKADTDTENAGACETRT